MSGLCSTDTLPVLPTGNVDRDYLAHYLSQQSVVDFATSRASGAILPRLSPAELARFQIPLPPIEERRRIAAILDQADALRVKRMGIDRGYGVATSEAYGSSSKQGAERLDVDLYESAGGHKRRA
ncbi:MAG: restriction endonuclease subunit S [Ornithinimicrobium sp.]